MSVEGYSEKEAENVSEMYFFFSRVFYEEPTDFFIKHAQEILKEGSLSPLFKEWGGDFERDLKMELKNLGDLVLEYNRLFVGPDEMLAPPYASLYMDKDKELFTKETYAVRDFYRRCAMVFEKEETEPSDHVGLELMFVGFLEEQRLKATNNSEEEQFIEENLNAFLGKHLYPWVFSFLSLVKERSESIFYKSLAILAEDFLKSRALKFSPSVDIREV